MWRNPRDSSSWDRKPADFTSVGYLHISVNHLLVRETVRERERERERERGGAERARKWSTTDSDPPHVGSTLNFYFLVFSVFFHAYCIAFGFSLFVHVFRNYTTSFFYFLFRDFRFKSGQPPSSENANMIFRANESWVLFFCTSNMYNTRIFLCICLIAARAHTYSPWKTALGSNEITLSDIPTFRERLPDLLTLEDQVRQPYLDIFVLKQSLHTSLMNVDTLDKISPSYL